MSEQEVKAVETEYAGVLFRSRLEARWALFFDLIGLKWEYEPDWFEFDQEASWLPERSRRYAPDFLVSGLVRTPFKAYFEIKREGLSFEEGHDAVRKAVALARLTNEAVVIGFGYPGGPMEGFRAHGFDGLPSFISDSCYFVISNDDKLSLVRANHCCPWTPGELIDNAVDEVRRHRFWNPNDGGDARG